MKAGLNFTNFDNTANNSFSNLAKRLNLEYYENLKLHYNEMVKSNSKEIDLSQVICAREYSQELRNFVQHFINNKSKLHKKYPKEILELLLLLSELANTVNNKELELDILESIKKHINNIRSISVLKTKEVASSCIKFIELIRIRQVDPHLKKVYIDFEFNLFKYINIIEDKLLINFVSHAVLQPDCKNTAESLIKKIGFYKKIKVKNGKKLGLLELVQDIINFHDSKIKKLGNIIIEESCEILKSKMAKRVEKIELILKNSKSLQQELNNRLKDFNELNKETKKPSEPTSDRTGVITKPGNVATTETNNEIQNLNVSLLNNFWSEIVNFVIGLSWKKIAKNVFEQSSSLILSLSKLAKNLFGNNIFLLPILITELVTNLLTEEQNNSITILKIIFSSAVAIISSSILLSISAPGLGLFISVAVCSSAVNYTTDYLCDEQIRPKLSEYSDMYYQSKIMVENWSNGFNLYK